jgi:hypothetical protein
MVTPRSGDEPRQGKRQGQAAKQPDPPFFGECNGCEDKATNGETQEIKDQPGAGLRSIDGIGSHAKPDEYGCR